MSFSFQMHPDDRSCCCASCQSKYWAVELSALIHTVKRVRLFWITIKSALHGSLLNCFEHQMTLQPTKGVLPNRVNTWAIPALAAGNASMTPVHMGLDRHTLRTTQGKAPRRIIRRTRLRLPPPVDPESDDFIVSCGKPPDRFSQIQQLRLQRWHTDEGEKR